MGTPLFFVTADAGGGRAPDRLRAILARTPWPDARTVLARSVTEVAVALRAAPDGAVAVAAGGDGTVNLVVRALREAGRGDLTLAVLPLGNGNLVAWALGVGRIGRALETLRAGELRRFDLFVTTHPAWPVVVASLSVGAEARVVHRFVELRPAGRRMAALRAAASLRRTPPRGEFTLEVDGDALVAPGDAGYCAGVYNHPCYPYGWTVLPGADPSDGVGEAVACRDLGSYLRALALGVPTTGPGRRDGVTSRRWRTAVVTTSGPVQMDGEILHGGRFELRVEPGALRALAARGRATPSAAVG